MRISDWSSDVCSSDLAGQRIRAVPGAGLDVPIWLLGSSLFSAQLAAQLGLPFAFASHFAPAAMMQAFEIHRSRFQPSEQLDRPYAMAGVDVFAADSDAEGPRLFPSLLPQEIGRASVRERGCQYC